MHFVHAVLLGMVEGLTEFLPVSSTGHLLLAARLLHLSQTEFIKSFEIAIQSGAIVAVLFLYGRILLKDKEALKRVCVAFIPTGILGFLLHKIVKKFLLHDTTVVLWSLLAGGIFLIVFERFHKEKDSHGSSFADISYPKAVLIGLCQSLAMVPGVSRSAATIVGGLAVGLKRKMIVEFSFLLAIPTLLAATALDLLKSSRVFSGSEWQLLGVGALVSFIVAIFSIKFFLRYIQKYDFTLFGVYRIAVALLFFGLIK